MLRLTALLLIAPLSLLAQVSPDILPNGRVTFRIVAPQAETVTVKGQWAKEPVKLEKKAKGLWEGTTSEAVQPGIHEYSFNVDKLRTLDSRNGLIKPQRWPKSSLLHIPAMPPAHWDIQDIPHGTVHHHDYFAKTLGMWRKLVVYTPPGYATSNNPLPVLFLSHGFSDNQEAWTTSGKTHWIMNSLLNKGLAKPMIIVMPDAHPIDPEARNDTYSERNTQAFAKELVADMVPFIEKHYNVSEKPSGRAFAGLSMGGGHAFTVAFQHHDKFSWIGAFSASAKDETYIRERAQVRQMNRNLQLFWIACGDKDFLFERNQTANALMTDLGIEHEYIITEGDNHSWPVWRRYLVDFLPKLF